MRKYILLLLVIPIVSLAGVRFGGYLENTFNAIYDKNANVADSSIFASLDTTGLILTDVATLRLEGYWDFNIGGIEAHLLINKAFNPLIPFVQSYKANSRMWDLSMGTLEGFLQLYLAPFPIGSDSSTFGDFWDTLSDEDKELYSEMGMQLPYSSFYPTDVLALDRALIKFYTPIMDIYVGRQPIAWGVGYAFRPTDIWNMRNPTDPNTPQIGVNALRFEIPLSDMAGISLIFSPGRSLDFSSAGTRIKWNVGNFDMSLVAITQHNADRALNLLKRKHLLGTDLVGQIGNIGVWYEASGGVRHENKMLTAQIRDTTDGALGNLDYAFDSTFLQIDAGLDYTFVNGLYLMGEYLYNSLGNSSVLDATELNFIDVMGGDAIGFGRHYLSYGGFKELGSTTLLLSLFGLSNLQDGSTMVLPGLLYPFHDNIDVEFKATVAIGNKHTTEYGGIRNSLTLKVKGYF